jgi:dTDP-4-dehydrorhamnose 3,5-epimerase
MIKKLATKLDGVFELQPRVFSDHRGLLVKPFHAESFADLGLATDFKETFYSVSNKNVLRGMHFQLPPHDHDKLVFVVAGEILDVAVDIRKGSETFGQYHSVVLSSDKANSVYIAKGFAHGFLTLSDSATVVYQTTTTHAPSHDSGIRWNSFGFEWGIDAPIISVKDEMHPGIFEKHHI